eukprot:538619-Pelagomonas_calceolata.AAC.2
MLMYAKPSPSQTSHPRPPRFMHAAANASSVCTALLDLLYSSLLIPNPSMYAVSAAWSMELSLLSYLGVLLQKVLVPPVLHV